jgi:hypothetical protein
VAKARPPYLKLHAAEERPEDFALSTSQLADVAKISKACEGLSGFELRWQPAGVFARTGKIVASFPVSRIGGVPLGELNLVRAPGGPKEGDLRRAREIGTALADLLSELARAQEALWRREAELAAGVPVTPHREEARHLAARLEAILQSGAKAVGCQAAALYLLDADTSHLKLRSASGLDKDRLALPARPLAGALADLEALLGHAVVLTEPAQLEQWNAPEIAHAAICLPVSSPTIPLGTVWFFSERSRDFTAEQTALLEIVAGRLAADLERETLLADALTGVGLRQKIAVAARSQELQLPHIAPLSDEWDVAGWTSPGTLMAHSFHDWTALGASDLGVFIGEIDSGPGRGSSGEVAAGFSVMALRAMLRACCETDHAPEALILRLNRLLWTISSGDLSADLLCGRLACGDGRLQIARAGAIGVLLISPRANWRNCSRSGLPLGCDPDTRYLEEEVKLEPGEILVLVTASLFAASGDDLQARGLAQLAEALRGDSRQRAHDLALMTEQLVRASRAAVESETAPGGSLVIVKRRD